MFVPGQLVICIDGRPRGGYGDERLPKTGEVCTVRESFLDAGHPYIRTEEHRNPARPYVFASGIRNDEPCFGARNFRPLTDSRIAIFKAMLAPSPAKETTDA